jgi:hypothetical protein
MDIKGYPVAQVGGPRQAADFLAESKVFETGTHAGSDKGRLHLEIMLTFTLFGLEVIPQASSRT